MKHNRLRHAAVILFILSACALGARLDIRVVGRSNPNYNTLHAPGSVVSLTASIHPARQGGYQWFHNNVQIVGATSQELVLPPLDESDTGNYHAEFFDGATTESSNTLTINVVEFPNSPIDRSFSAALPDFSSLSTSPFFFDDGRIAVVYRTTDSPRYLAHLAADGSVLKLMQIPDSADRVLEWLPDGGILTIGPPHQFHFDAEAAQLEIPEDFFFVYGHKIRHAVVHPDGKLYLTNGVDILRFHADGSVDEAFKLKEPRLSAIINELKLDHLGRLYVLGQPFQSQWSERSHAYRLREDGSLDPTFAEQTTNGFLGISLFPLADGRIIKEVSDNPRKELSLLDTTGNRDPDWSVTHYSGFPTSVDAEQNLIYIFDYQQGWIRSRVRPYNLTSNGIEIDDSHYAGWHGDGPYHASTGQLYTTGRFTSWEGHPTTGIALLNPGVEIPESIPPTVYLVPNVLAGVGEEVRLKPF